MQKDEWKKVIKRYPGLHQDWRDLLWPPHPDLVELLLEYTRGRSFGSADKSDVIAFLGQINRLTPRLITLDQIEVNVAQDGPFKDKHVGSATLDGDPIPLRSNTWDDLVVSVCTRIYRENPDDFARVLHQITSRKNRIYFTQDKAQLTRCSVVAESGIYVEMNLSANNAHELCQCVRKLFGYRVLDVRP